MLATTKKLKDIIHCNPELDSSIVRSYLAVIANYGGLEDARGLLQVFMEEPADYNRTLLLEPIMKHGDLELAEDLYEFAIEQHKLKEDMPSEILHVLGYLGYTGCTETLVSLLTSEDWHLSKDAALGLLHLPCHGYEQQIRTIIDNSIGKSLFDEFVPALSYKVANNEMVPKLFEWGNSIVSTDCNAGIILGIALYGPDYKDVIKDILWSENWEAHDTSTGTRNWSYAAMQHVQLTFRELIEDLKSAQIPKRDLFHRLSVLSEMLECKLTLQHQPLRFAATNDESIFDIYRELFEWSNSDHDDSIIGLIARNLQDEFDLLNKYNHLRDKLEMKMEHLIEVNYLKGEL
ncbi:hypothetical protein [Paenibacillus glycanilyticus]|uniref:HEAT repeat domain-containing protein n=1 Tax=Paenibacillus glycanilyticus TaxID=126569 RepID=A0ABQ6G8K1_9BACL|nr:hypothetical protein [Paenibacillus glycanilyticus]GLX66825.1 hypothetical protein MU1_11690 [Paenibacillus glycanilyticus]